MRMVAVVGSRTYTGAEAKAVVLEASRAQRHTVERQEQLRVMSRRPRGAGEAANIRFAMQAIEHRIVRGLWVLEISQTADGPRHQSQHGIGYLPEYLDHYGTIASGGKWENGPARPAIPSSKEIDAAKEAQGWIRCLEEDQARLLNIAAQTKRGDRARRVNWERVRDRIPALRDCPMRTLQDRYDQALRWIVAELTIQRAEK